MGNVLALEATEDSSDDARYLAITDKVLASDTLVDSLLKDLTRFQVPQDPTALVSEEESAAAAVEFPLKVTRLVQLFSQRPSHPNSNFEQSQVSEGMNL